MKLWATRTIRDGRVRIGGRYYYPDKRWMEYDGRLDGLRYVFGLYQYKPELIGMIRQMGSPIRFDPADPDSYSENRPEIVDGALPWLFWMAVD